MISGSGTCPPVRSGPPPQGQKGLGVHSLAFTPDGHALAAGSSGGTVRLLDLAPGGKRTAFYLSPKAQAVWQGWEMNQLLFGGSIPIRPEVQDQVRAAAFSPDGRTLAVASAGGGFKRWDTASGRELPPLSGDHANVGCVAYSPDGRTLATNHQSEVRLRDTATGKLRHTLSRAHRPGQLPGLFPGRHAAGDRRDRLSDQAVGPAQRSGAGDAGGPQPGGRGGGVRPGRPDSGQRRLGRHGSAVARGHGPGAGRAGRAFRQGPCCGVLPGRDGPGFRRRIAPPHRRGLPVARPLRRGDR